MATVLITAASTILYPFAPLEDVHEDGRRRKVWEGMVHMLHTLPFVGADDDATRILAVVRSTLSAEWAAYVRDCGWFFLVHSGGGHVMARVET